MVTKSRRFSFVFVVIFCMEHKNCHGRGYHGACIRDRMIAGVYWVFQRQKTTPYLECRRSKILWYQLPATFLRPITANRTGQNNHLAVTHTIISVRSMNTTRWLSDRANQPPIFKPSCRTPRPSGPTCILLLGLC